MSFSLCCLLPRPCPPFPSVERVSAYHSLCVRAFQRTYLSETTNARPDNMLYTANVPAATPTTFIGLMSTP